MKNKLGFALCLLLAAVFTGCKEDEEGKHHFSNQVFISATSFTDDVFIKRDNLDVTREESCDVTVAMAQPRERDITVTFAEAPGLSLIHILLSLSMIGTTDGFLSDKSIR